MSTEEEVIAAVRLWSTRHLLPRATHTDVSGVPREHLDRLRELGALRARTPERLGGLGVSATGARTLIEILSGACPNTWLIYGQHATVVEEILRRLPRLPALSPTAYRVLRGEGLAGAAISDVRRFPERHLAAEPTSEGWEISGTVSWFTGLGLSDALMLSAVDRGAGDPEVITAVVPFREGITAEPLPLAALGGSRTVRLHLDRMPVHHDEVIAHRDWATWQRDDRESADRPRPQVFGLAARVLQELLDDPLPEARELGENWLPHVARLKARSYAAAANPRVPAGELRGLRTHADEVLSTLSRALLAARGGRGLMSGDPAQLYARTAHFLLVQTQSAQVRRAQLAQLSSPPATGVPTA